VADLYDLTSQLDLLRNDIEQAFGEMDELREKADKYDEIGEAVEALGDLNEAKEKLDAYDNLEAENEEMKAKIERLEETNTRLQQAGEKHLRALADDAAGLVQQIKNLLADEAVLVPSDPTAADHAGRLLSAVANLYVVAQARATAVEAA